jgi:hypothetical protein
MRHWIAGLAAFTLLAGNVCDATELTWPSGTNVPGTILDANGNGTGLTHRLPGTGSSYPMANPDPNLNMSTTPGVLDITSTLANLDGRSRAGLEAFGLLLPNPGANDITIEAKFLGTDIGNVLSNQLMLYAANSAGDSIRAGLHRGSPSGYLSYTFASNQLGGDAGYYDSGSIFSNGEDVIISLARTSGTWEVSWQNLTNPSKSGTSGSIAAFNWLDNQDLYVGIHYANPRTSTQYTTGVEYFRADGVPEPSTPHWPTNCTRKSKSRRGILVVPPGGGRRLRGGND